MTHFFLGGEDEQEALDRKHTAIQNALVIARRYGWIDGDHHKAWVIDQMVRALTGSEYATWIKRSVDWSEGIAP
jgi:hypothetical protein